MMPSAGRMPVIRIARNFLAHVPGLVRHGSKPARELATTPGLADRLASHLRPYAAALAYPPHHAFLGGLDPDALRGRARPWFRAEEPAPRWQPHGELMPEGELYGWLRIVDGFELVALDGAFTREVRQALAEHPLVEKADLDRLGDGHPASAIEERLASPGAALPLQLADGRLVGAVSRGHEADATLTAEVVLENLACKATAVLALRAALRDGGYGREAIPYVLNSGEEAVGERYQRGGGNLAKAIAEGCGLVEATGADVKAFCCGPVHALVLAGALVAADVFPRVAVVGGGSLAKLGMKFQGHLQHDQPILEDTLAAVAAVVEADDGASPVLRLDAVGRHPVGAGSSQQAILERLVQDPLARLGLGFRDVDKYATELHNPELTEPSGSGDVPRRNYQLLGALAVAAGAIPRAELPAFVARHGLPGFAPTQGHIASAIPYLARALDRLRDGTMQRVMLLAKGSLFLGRMTQLSDGMSVVLERNPRT
jgi:hypothetical protein